MRGMRACGEYRGYAIWRETPAFSLAAVIDYDEGSRLYAGGQDDGDGQRRIRASRASQLRPAITLLTVR